MSRYLRTPAVSEKSGVPEHTLRKWRSLGVGPKSIKLRGVVVYPEQDLDEWISAQGAETTRGDGADMQEADTECGDGAA